MRGTARFVGEIPVRPLLPSNAHAAHGAMAGCGADALEDDSLVVDASSRGVAHTVVWLEPLGTALPHATSAAPSLEPARVLDQHRCRFSPHVLAVRVDAPVRFSNSDPGVLHNVHAYQGLDERETVFNLATPSGLSVQQSFHQPGLYRLVCDAGHGWMLAYVHAFAHGFFALTDAQGRFVIEHVPQGRYRLFAWHEGFVRTERTAHGRPSYSAPLTVTGNLAVRRADLRVDLELSASPTPALRIAPPSR